jgi:hypothetical protein
LDDQPGIEPLPPVALKGFAEKVEVFRVVNG